MKKVKSESKSKGLSNEGIILIILVGILCVGLAIGAVRHFRKGDIELVAVQQAPLTVNINLAGSQELTRLPGIGAELAERIVSYREEHGDFSHCDSLVSVSGIGEGKLAEIKPYIEVR